MYDTDYVVFYQKNSVNNLSFILVCPILSVGHYKRMFWFVHSDFWNLENLELKILIEKDTSCMRKYRTYKIKRY